MASEEQRARRRAQRELAKSVREHRRHILPGSMKGTAARKANLAYADGVLNGTIPQPAKGTLESRMLARLASQSQWGQIDPKYQALSNHFYKKKGSKDIADEDNEGDRNEGDESEEGEK
jgi:hypothetical protein